jgi:hypothetical protein
MALFRTIARGTGRLSTSALPEANAYATVRRRALAAGIDNRFMSNKLTATSGALSAVANIWAAARRRSACRGGETSRPIAEHALTKMRSTLAAHTTPARLFAT